jgi:glycosyltransferase involved in cell wall biosynthesis
MNRALYIQYTNPGGYPPLQHSSRILADAGWSVLFLGTGAWGANSLEFPPHPGIVVRRIPFCAGGWRQKLHYIRFCMWVMWTVLVWRPTWVYASDPLACPVVLTLAWIPGLKVLYHEHDSPDASNSRRRSEAFVLRARRWVARRANLCILPNVKRLERFEAALGPLRSVVCVWNCPSRCEVVAEPRRTATEPICVLYHGSIVPDRLPLSVLHALALLPSVVRLRVVGYETAGSHGYVSELRQRARELGIADRVEFLNAMPRWELLRANSIGDIGLAMVPMLTTHSNFLGMTGASNKAFDYMACGMALLVSNLADWREIFVEPEYARGCDPGDPHSIAAALRWFVDHPDRMRAMGESGRQRILSEWNYENMFDPVLRRLSKAGFQDSAAHNTGKSGGVRRSV